MADVELDRRLRMLRSRWIGFLLALSLVMAACNGAAPAETTEAPEAAAPPPTLTSTLPPAPTSTPAPTLTWTPAPTATPSAAFDELTFVNFEKGTYGARMIFDLPGVSVPYDVSVAGLQYTCVLVEERPNRVVCLGSLLPPPDKRIPFVLMMPGTQQIVYQTELLFPSGTYWALIPEGHRAVRPSWCGPIDYASVRCEMECRVESDGPCLAASCWDACGYAFSVHSCHEDPPQPACNAEQRAEQKALYGIP
jgi:hypothetical protein